VAIVLLLIQNIGITFPAIAVFSVLESININSYTLISILFYVDILGFFFLGIGFSLFPTSDTTERKLYLASGIFVLSWVLCRCTWQFLITENNLGNLASFLQTPTGAMGVLELIGDQLQDINLLLLIGGMTLWLGSYILHKTQKRSERRLLSNYCFTNFIAVCLISVPLILVTISSFFTLDLVLPNQVTALLIFIPFLGLLMKLLVVPLLGVYTFSKLFLKYSRREYKRLPGTS
jgi:hypothetical protein